MLGYTLVQTIVDINKVESALVDHAWFSLTFEFAAQDVADLRHSHTVLVLEFYFLQYPGTQLRDLLVPAAQTPNDHTNFSTEHRSGCPAE
jgi:hypothetical protein